MIPPIARRFVAGESAATAIEHARQMNADGVNVILNLLGEHYDDRADADADATAYVGLIQDISRTGIDACVSVKPSQLGLDLGADVFEENFRRIVEAGDEHDVFVWCDMEDATTTDTTLDAFETLATEYEWQVGLCLQSNLKRTAADLHRVGKLPGKIRMTKGAYDEGPRISYTDKSVVDERYREDLEYLFVTRDRGIAVGSHDPAMIDYAKQLADEHGGEFEIQMLMGVREDAQRELAADGYEVWQYAPYGNRWMSYFYRRVRERKENVLFALRAVAGR